MDKVVCKGVEVDVITGHNASDPSTQEHNSIWKYIQKDLTPRLQNLSNALQLETVEKTRLVPLSKSRNKIDSGIGIEHCMHYNYKQDLISIHALDE